MISGVDGCCQTCGPCVWSVDSVSEVSGVCMRETVSVAQVVFEVKVYAYETGKGCAYTIHMCGACFMYVCMCIQWVTLHNS